MPPPVLPNGHLPILEPAEIAAAPTAREIRTARRDLLTDFRDLGRIRADLEDLALSLARRADDLGTLAERIEANVRLVLAVALGTPSDAEIEDAARAEAFRGAVTGIDPELYESEHRFRGTRPRAETSDAAAERDEREFYQGGPPSQAEISALSDEAIIGLTQVFHFDCRGCGIGLASPASIRAGRCSNCAPLTVAAADEREAAFRRAAFEMAANELPIEAIGRLAEADRHVVPMDTGTLAAGAMDFLDDEESHACVEHRHTYVQVRNPIG